jgi:hypothetical protein
VSNSGEEEFFIRGLFPSASFTTDGRWICVCSSDHETRYGDIYKASRRNCQMVGAFQIKANTKLSKGLDLRSELLLPFHDFPQFIVQDGDTLVVCRSMLFEQPIIRMPSALSSDRLRFGAVLDTQNAVVLMRESLLGRARVDIIPFTDGKAPRVVSCGKLKIRFDPFTCGAAIRREGNDVFLLVSHPDGRLEMQLLDLGPEKSDLEAPPGSSTGGERSTSRMDDIPSFYAKDPPLAPLETSHDLPLIFHPIPPPPVLAEPARAQSLGMNEMALPGREFIADLTPSMTPLDIQDSSSSSEPFSVAEGRKSYGSTQITNTGELGQSAGLQNEPKGRDIMPYDHNMGTDSKTEPPSGDSGRSQSPRNRFFKADSSNLMSMSTSLEKNIDPEHPQLVNAKQLLTDVGLAHLATPSIQTGKQSSEGKSISHTFGGGLEETDYGDSGNDTEIVENTQDSERYEYSSEHGPNPQDNDVLLETDVSGVSKTGPLDYPAKASRLA